LQSAIQNAATSTITTKQRKSVMSKLYDVLKTTHEQLEADNDSDSSDADDNSSSNSKRIDAEILHALAQHIECSQYAAASDTTTYSDTNTLVTRWQYIAEQFLTQLYRPVHTAGKKRKHCAVYVAKPYWTPLRNKYAGKHVRWLIKTVDDNPEFVPTLMNGSILKEWLPGDTANHDTAIYKGRFRLDDHCDNADDYIDDELWENEVRDAIRLFNKCHNQDSEQHDDSSDTDTDAMEIESVSDFNDANDAHNDAHNGAEHGCDTMDSNAAANTDGDHNGCKTLGNDEHRDSHNYDTDTQSNAAVGDDTEHDCNDGAYYDDTIDTDHAADHNGMLTDDSTHSSAASNATCEAVADTIVRDVANSTSSTTADNDDDMSENSTTTADSVGATAAAAATDKPAATVDNTNQSTSNTAVDNHDDMFERDTTTAAGATTAGTAATAAADTDTPVPDTINNTTDDTTDGAQHHTGCTGVTHNNNTTSSSSQTDVMARSVEVIVIKDEEDDTTTTYNSTTSKATGAQSNINTSNYDMDTKSKIFDLEQCAGDVIRQSGVRQCIQDILLNAFRGVRDPDTSPDTAGIKPLLTNERALIVELKELIRKSDAPHEITELFGDRLFDCFI
jgi:hypothetical protein